MSEDSSKEISASLTPGTIVYSSRSSDEYSRYGYMYVIVAVIDGRALLYTQYWGPNISDNYFVMPYCRNPLDFIPVEDIMISSERIVWQP